MKRNREENPYYAELFNSLSDNNPEIPPENRVFFPSNAIEIIIKNLNYREVRNMCSADVSFQKWCKKNTFTIWRYMLVRDYPQINIKEVESPEDMYMYLIRVQKFLVKYTTGKIYRHYIFANPSLSYEFISKNLDDIRTWNSFESNKYVPHLTIINMALRAITESKPSFATNNTEMLKSLENSINNFNISRIVRNRTSRLDITEKFIDENRSVVNWGILSQNPSFGDEFWERHLDKIHWDAAPINKSLSEFFWMRHSDRIEWGMFSAWATTVSMDFWERHLDEINWNQLGFNTSLTVEFLEKYKDRIDWRSLAKNPSVPLEFWENNIDRIYWLSISRAGKLPMEFYEKYSNKTNWKHLAQGDSNFPIEFWWKHLDKIDNNVGLLSGNTSLDFTFWSINFDKIDTTRILTNTSLPLEFWEMYLNVVDVNSVGEDDILWEQLLTNPMLPERYFNPIPKFDD